MHNIDATGMKRECLDDNSMGIDKKLKMDTAKQSFLASYPLLSSLLDFEGGLPDQIELERVMNQLITEFNELNKQMNTGLMLEEAKQHKKSTVSPTPRKVSKCKCNSHEIQRLIAFLFYMSRYQSLRTNASLKKTGG